jgi:hypothetical protein
MRARLLTACALIGCSDPPRADTGGLRSNELSLQVLTETDELETRVAVGIYAISDRYSRLTLMPGEKLLLHVAGSAPIEFERASDSSVATYRARVALTEGDLTIDLERGDDSARGTIVHLPPAFTIDKPRDGLHLDQPFTMTWSPAVATARVTATIVSECVRAGARTLAFDSGSFTWSAADFTTTDEPLPCTATIQLVRDGGSIEISPGVASLQLFRAEQKRAFGVLASRP